MSVFRNTTLLLFGAIFTTFIYGLELPDYFRICGQKDPHLNECILNASKSVVPKIIKGIEYLNVPELSPLKIPEIDLDQGDNLNLKLINVTVKGLETAKLRDVESKMLVITTLYKSHKISSSSLTSPSLISCVKHFSPFIINDVLATIFEVPESLLHICILYGAAESLLRANLTSQSIASKIHFDRIVFDSFYKVKGRVIILPINGNGTAKINFDDVLVYFTFDYVLIDKKGDKYVNITDVGLSYELNRAVYKLDNLFNGDKFLGEQMNRFINDNWDTLHQDFAPIISETIKNIVVDILKEVAILIPYKNIFAESQ